MSQTDPANTTAGDIVTAALKDAGALGIGQTALAEDLSDGMARLQWMLQEWERKRWLVYHLVNLSVISTGALTYSVGPGGDIDTGADSVRPAKIESSFLRQLVQSQPNQVDYPMRVLQSREDYDRIALKRLVSFPGLVFLDTGWPLATLYTYPVPQANIYSVHISVLAQLPFKFATQATKFVLPYEYYQAMVSNLALRLRPKYGLGSYPGDMVPAMAKESLNVLRGANVQIGTLVIDPALSRSGIYNIFSDQVY